MGLNKKCADAVGSPGNHYGCEEGEKQSTTEYFQKDIPNSIPAINVKYVPVNKDKRILVQGILQAVIQSQGLLLEPNEGYINKVKEVTLDLVKFVEEHSK